MLRVYPFGRDTTGRSAGTPTVLFRDDAGTPAGEYGAGQDPAWERTMKRRETGWPVVLFTLTDTIWECLYFMVPEMSWSFEKQRLLKYPGVNAQKFPLFLQELQFRYERCDQDLDDRIQVLTGYSCVAYTE